MSIIRNQINFSADFVQIPNSWMRDGRLSHRARGILAEVMTHSDGWEITVQHLVHNGTEGREAVRSAIKELVQLGYLRQVRVQGDDGKLKGSQYVTQIPPDDQQTTYRAPKNPSAGKPGAQESTTKNTISKNTNVKNTNNTSGAADAGAGAAAEVVLVEEKPAWDVIAQLAYDGTQGALPYMGMRGIAKWAIERKEADPASVESAIAGLYRSGQAVTKQSVAQVLDGVRGTRKRDEYTPSWQKRLDANIQAAQADMNRDRGVFEIGE